MNDTQKPSRTTTGRASKGFTDDERAAMKEHAQELKADVRRGPRASQADGESDVLAKIAEMPESDRAMAERLHAVIKGAAPALTSRTWYGMPAYAKDGTIICFFQPARKGAELRPGQPGEGLAAITSAAAAGPGRAAAGQRRSGTRLAARGSVMYFLNRK
jgi:hypothetical protein